MSATERMQKLLTASPTMLAKIDKVLDGEDASPKPEADCRTITFTQAAKRLGVSRPTIYRLTKAGRLKVVPLLGVNRIALSSVVDFVNEGGK